MTTREVMQADNCGACGMVKALFASATTAESSSIEAAVARSPYRRPDETLSGHSFA
jgi:hypothetical protein